jgi:alkyldihydroxyacetonephosphate synthase
VITALRIEVSPTPATRVYEGWRLPSFVSGTEALRALGQDGPLPTVLRLSDEAETALNLARPAEIGAGSGAGCLAIAGFEGSEEDVHARRAGAGEVLRAHGGELDPEAGDGWLHGRYAGPYLRDALLDAGALVETLETATFWSNLQALYQAVSGSVRESLTALGTPPVVLCHISHTYRAGASLYFTIGAAQLDDPMAQWATAKRAASDAILAVGGTITHHHGVGTDHRDHYATEIGPLAVEALRAVKAALDPTWIMNPGVLVPPVSPGSERT